MQYSLHVDGKLYKIEIFVDDHRWIATSPDIKGLVCEEYHLNDLLDSVDACARVLLEEAQ